MDYLNESWRLTSSYWIGKRTKRRWDSFNKGSSPTMSHDNLMDIVQLDTIDLTVIFLQTFRKVNVAKIEPVIIEVTAAHLVAVPIMIGMSRSKENPGINCNKCNLSRKSHVVGTHNKLSNLMDPIRRKSRPGGMSSLSRL